MGKNIYFDFRIMILDFRLKIIDFSSLLAYLLTSFTAGLSANCLFPNYLDSRLRGNDNSEEAHLVLWNLAFHP